MFCKSSKKGVQSPYFEGKLEDAAREAGFVDGGPESVPFGVDVRASRF
jgi:hypothetical protein